MVTDQLTAIGTDKAFVQQCYKTREPVQTTMGAASDHRSFDLFLLLPASTSSNG